MTASRLRTRRLGAILATALLAVALVPGLTTAADTRILSIGAPGSPGTLRTSDQPTKVSKPASGTGPNATMFQVQIRNDGGQNLANTILTINANNSGANGLAFATIYDPDPTGEDDASPTYCSPSGNIVTCNYGSLRAGKARTVAVVVSVSDTYAAGAGPLFSATVTTNNENGSNVQTRNADSGDFAVGAFDPDAVNTFVFNGTANLFTAPVGSGGNLNTNVKFNANKQLVAINEGDTGVTGFYVCPAGLSCQNDYSEVTTSVESFTAPPFFTWKLTAIVSKAYTLSQGFVAHYPAGATTYLFNQPNNDYWTLFFKDKSAMCGSDIAAKIASAKQCIKSLALTKSGQAQQLVVEVVMDHQGGLKY